MFTSHETSYITLSNSCNLDMDVRSISKLSNEGLHIIGFFVHSK